MEVASQFIATVVCELILRDTQLFAIKYVRRITLGFVRTGLEDDPGHVSTRGQQSYFMGSGDDDDDQEYPESEPDADQFDEHDETHREIQFDEIEEERIKSALEEVDQSDTHMSVQSSISIDESITK